MHCWQNAPLNLRSLPHDRQYGISRLLPGNKKAAHVGRLVFAYLTYLHYTTGITEICGNDFAVSRLSMIRWAHSRALRWMLRSWRSV